MTTVNIENIVRGICNLKHNKELYHEQIEDFCALMRKTNFAHKVSAVFRDIYKPDFEFDPDTEEDQLVNNLNQKGFCYHARLIDEETYLILKDYEPLSIPITTQLAKTIVEKGITYLPKELYVHI